MDPRGLAGPGGVADERSVDMDEPTNPAPGSGSRRRTAPAGQLSPPQQAWGRYVGHSLHCPRCQDIDAGACAKAERLYRAWRELTEDAYRRLASD